MRIPLSWHSTSQSNPRYTFPVHAGREFLFQTMLIWESPSFCWKTILTRVKTTLLLLAQRRSLICRLNSEGMTANLNSGSPNHYNVLFGLTTDPDDTPTDIPHTFAGSTLQTVVFLHNVLLTQNIICTLSMPVYFAVQKTIVWKNYSVEQKISVLIPSICLPFIIFPNSFLSTFRDRDQ